MRRTATTTVELLSELMQLMSLNPVLCRTSLHHYYYDPIVMENGTNRHHSCSPDSEENLLAPYHYIRQMPGKHIRSELAKAFNVWLQIDPVKLDKIMELVEMLHNASLMIDDIEDNSVLRRGLPVTHNVYGVPSTINTANYIYFMALSKCIQLDHPQAIVIFTEKMLELHRGQGKELYWRDSYTCPTEEDYELMVKQKTGGLFSLAVQLMQLFSTSSEDFTHLVNNLALYFQIRDDYVNLTSLEYAKEKSFAEDLTEGKFSYPIINAILSKHKTDERIMNILRRRTTDNDVKRYCISLIREQGAFGATESKLIRIMEDIVANVDALQGNSLLSALLKKIDIMSGSNKVEHVQSENGEEKVEA
ncbi:hypothetical protein L596_004718 [Steinernema carpocapsae]|uniref:Geranylgeranyl pyrophosphate synthase n=1 Tax=Steinernema carpocapsae TaxID=34508 RepID=A0A4U8V0U7_STECR|nr:hypothetical protein L596_004718 [Steinernema carpocapsae]